MFLLTPVLNHAQVSVDSDTSNITISFPKPVHFGASEGGDVLVPSGTYWVLPEQNSLLLFGLENSETYKLAAIKGESGKKMSDSTATSLPGPKGEPDAHYVT